MTVLLWPDPGGGEDPWAGMVVRARFVGPGRPTRPDVVHGVGAPDRSLRGPPAQPEQRGYVDTPVGLLRLMEEDL